MISYWSCDRSEEGLKPPKFFKIDPQICKWSNAVSLILIVPPDSVMLMREFIPKKRFEISMESRVS